MRDPLIALGLATAATLAIALSAACTTVEPYRAGAATPARTAGTTLYCWKDRLNDASDQLVCNWSESRYDACNSKALSAIDKKRVASQGPATRCENGQSLIAVTLG
jgi:hypothetical protein